MEVARGMNWAKISAPLFRLLARREKAGVSARGICLLQLN
jgi:hypothetical protein